MKKFILITASVFLFTTVLFGQCSVSIAGLTNVTCNGSCNGSASATASGGTAPYTYSWSNLTTSQVVTGICAGTYTVTITDNVGCTSTASVTITQPTMLTATITSQTNVLCNGVANGTATVTASGGIPPYTYDWSPNGFVGDGTLTYSGLVAGVYAMTVTDVNACTKTTTVTITQPSVVSSSISSSTNVTCYGGSNGTVNVTVSGGNPPYAWNIGAGYQPSGNFNNLPAGTYSVTISDANNCTSVSSSVSINQPSALNVSVSNQSNVTCNGTSNGSAIVNASGGMSGYSYIWSSGQTTNSAIGLAAGNYTVTVSDIGGCTSTITVTITQPPAVTSTFSAPSTICFGENFVVTYTGNASGLATYSWNFGGATILSGSGSGPYALSFPSAGTYTISLQVTDVNGCTSSVSTVNITVNPPISITFTQVNPTCIGNDGSIDITVTGGSLPYNYMWTNTVSTQDQTNLIAGTYVITVVDAVGCIASQVVSLVQNSQLGELTGLNTYSGGYLPSNEFELYLFKSSTSGAAQMDTVNYVTNSAPWYFGNLLPGTYYLKANLLNPSNYPGLMNSYYDSTYTWQDAVPIAINCDDSVDVIFKMYEIVMSTGGTGDLSGTIYTVGSKSGGKAAGEPVSGAEILIEQEPNDVPVQASITNSQGQYFFTGLEEGSGYYLVVDIPGYPMLSTYQNITINTDDSITNLDFLVDSTTGGGVFIDNSSWISPVNIERIKLEIYPNPIVEDVNIKLYLPEENKVVVEFYDELGKRVQTKDLGILSKGSHDFKWQSKKSISGTNYIMVRVGNSFVVKKLISVK